ncbi:MAG: redox-sensing transcriptional repressor Rex [Phycisphaerales bacterium]|nr:MAG: redox-sensing transcriptional repressor Rex [Phycisphaerales bacterium]
MRYHRIPDETVRRLPIYLRALLFAADQGQESISSRDLADFVGVNPWQIRKDFSYFGEFGTRGVGYDIYELAQQIKKILKLDVTKQAALVGVGNLGSAILAYPDLRMFGLDITAVFDVNPRKIGRKVGDVEIESVSRLRTLERRKINLAIIAVPRNAAQKVAEALVRAGVMGILNFSACYITVPRRVKVITIDIATDLARLPYYVPTR